MRYLHTMVRVRDIDAALRFFCEGLGLEEVRRRDSDKGRFTLVFLGQPGASAADSPHIELTYNWDETEAYSTGRNFGHVAYEVEDIYRTCQQPGRPGLRHQPAAARWPHGLRALARRHLGRAAPEGRGAGACGTLGVDGEHRHLVTRAARVVPPAGSVAQAAPVSKRGCTGHDGCIRSVSCPPGSAPRC